ncbi:hypothetical protein [Rhodoplanes sp. Z2-YC6860]|uniref:hypothetical protein n=1 Tax=Rhodoplanes sp. Z2-YC6860 TaxID=674703 RepID=UPI00082E0CD6|nr:hypothetical protein [Rhodoplanes sp. Z2-YC6860]
MIRVPSRHGKSQQRQKPFADFRGMAVVFVGLDSHAWELRLLLVWRAFTSTEPMFESEREARVKK